MYLYNAKINTFAGKVITLGYVSVDDGKITKIESTLEAKGENMTYSGATFKITSINTFDHSVNDKVA